METTGMRERREALGLAQGEVADRARVSKRSVMRVEAGDPVQPSTLRAVEAALGIDAAMPEAPAARRPAPVVVRAGLGENPLADRFAPALERLARTGLVIYPDVEACRRSGKPGLKEFLVRLNPMVFARWAVRTGRREDLYAIIIFILAMSAALTCVTLTRMPGASWLSAPIFLAKLACLGSLGTVIWDRAMHPRRLRALERTVVAVSRTHAHLVEAREGASSSSKSTSASPSRARATGGEHLFGLGHRRGGGAALPPGRPEGRLRPPARQAAGQGAWLPDEARAVGQAPGCTA